MKKKEKFKHCRMDNPNDPTFELSLHKLYPFCGLFHRNVLLKSGLSATILLHTVLFMAQKQSATKAQCEQSLYEVVSVYVFLSRQK